MSHGRSHKRRVKWGQNFLVNPGVSRRIVEALGDLSGRAVVEIGPGQGALTSLLLERAHQVVAVEIDATLASALADRFAGRPLELVVADALRVDWSDLAARALATGAVPPVSFVGNLPYESGTALLQAWLAASARDERLAEGVVMLQSEVAERVAARPSTKAYGALAVTAQSTHVVSSIAEVGPGSFRPIPTVWSRVIRLVRRPDPLFPPDQREHHVALLHAAFSQRRKQVAGVLAGVRGLTRERWQELLQGLGHPPTARAEELSPPELIELSRRAGG